MWWIISISAAVVAAVTIYILTHLARSGYYKYQDDWLKNEFSRCNVIVFGKKGTGKDLIFSHVIYLRNDNHYANMPYDGKTKVIEVKDIAVGDNSYEDIINDTIRPIDPCFEPGKDIYISDAGIYLPCQYNTELNKKYKSFPLFYALSRQLYQNNIHANTQALNRPWDKLREQADSYIRILGNEKYKKFIIVTAISYDKYESAAKGLLPCSEAQFKATNGEIKYRRFKIFYEELKYDTYYFATKFFTEQIDFKKEEILACLRNETKNAK